MIQQAVREDMWLICGAVVKIDHVNISKCSKFSFRCYIFSRPGALGDEDI